VRSAVAALVAGAAVVLLIRSDRLGWLARRGSTTGSLSWPAGRRAVFAAAAVGAAGGALAGAVACVLIGAAAAVVAHRWQQRLAAAQLSRRRSAEVELLAALAAELRAGRQSGSALALVEAVAGTGLGDALADARAAAAAGGDVAAALRDGAPEGGTLARLAAAWQVSVVAGAPLAEVVARVEAELRAVAAVHEKADAELAGARATGGLLAMLPLLGVGLGQAMGARPLHVLLDTPVGALCSGAGLALELAGLAWVQRLTGGAVGTVGGP